MKKWLSLFLLFVLVGCSKDEDTSAEVVSFKVTISPSLQYGKNANNLYNQFSAQFGSISSLDWKGNAQSQALSVWESGDQPAVSGNLSININMVNYYDYVCRQVKVETYVDGSLSNTSVYSLGNSGSLSATCPDGVSSTYSVNIP